MTARIKASAKRGEFTAFVSIDDSPEVRVRFRRSEVTDQWRCDQCGRHRFATCAHEVAARQAHQASRRGPRP